MLGSLNWDSPRKGSIIAETTGGSKMGTPNRVPQECSRTIRSLVGVFLACSYYVLGFLVLGFLF